jgi:pyruvate formate lyase activating enzyme
VSATTTEGFVFEIKRYAVDDGPGIRSTVFLKGCPLRCLWCHNPEGQILKPELMYRKNKCIGCQECSQVCPEGALTSSKKLISIDRRLCTLCGTCQGKCPNGAIEVVGKKLSVEAVLKEVIKDKVFFEESNGGVTFSGGEPLMQVGFLKKLLNGCGKEGVHTALETCGYASREDFDQIVEKVDLFLYDLKVMNNRVHKRYTGVSNRLILENLARLADSGCSIVVRFPVISGVNDDDENVSEMGDFLRRNGVVDIQVLPYHRAGIEKYRSLGRRYRLNRVESPSGERLKSIMMSLHGLGLNVKIGGG